MLAPLSWLKEYIDVTLKPKDLGERLTEVGLSCEKIVADGKDLIFELEITPNRPDLLSIIGISREIAALENKQINYPKFKTEFDRKPKRELPLRIETDSKINPRFSAVIIDGVAVKESPAWIKERLIKIGQRPINNIVDITNYVMFELGNPLHSFDWDKISGHHMEVALAKGGESFKSVDGISYHLPKDALIIKDKEKIIDLCGIKGGFNTATLPQTKTIVLRAPVEIPTLVRKASQSLGLRSEASSIFERGVNRGGTIDALARATDLILEIAGGEIASTLFDIKEEEFKPWNLKLRLARLNQILGIEIPQKKILDILKSLNLKPVILGTPPSAGDSKISFVGQSGDSGRASLARMTFIETSIPTYRNDLQIEEDLIEEVARIYGYNNFPKTIPVGEIPTKQIPYFRDYRKDEKIKNILKASHFYEVYTYSLISEADLENNGINQSQTLRIDNPVSKEFEYLRPRLKPHLIKAVLENKAIAKDISLFEIGKVYKGKTVDRIDEHYAIAGITTQKSFYEVKGILERLCDEVNSNADLSEYIEIVKEGVYFEFPYELLLREPYSKVFKPLHKYPPVVEDIALILGPTIKVGDVISEIKKQDKLISKVSLLDAYQNTKTFHIVYQDPEKNLTNEKVATIREKIIKHLKEKFDARLKE